MEYGGRSSVEHKLVWVGIIGIVALLLTFVAYTFWPYERSTAITIGPKTFYAEVADTEESREAGLTQRTALKEDQAFLIVYDANDIQPITTRDMQFPVDIVWIDQNKKVAFVARNAVPSVTGVYRPSGKTRYVMMLSAGATAKYSITVGKQIEFSYESEV